MVGAAESRISQRLLEPVARVDAAAKVDAAVKSLAVARFPAASATRTEKEWLRLVARLDLGVKLQLRPLTEALPRKDVPE